MTVVIVSANEALRVRVLDAGRLNGGLQNVLVSKVAEVNELIAEGYSDLEMIVVDCSVLHPLKVPEGLATLARKAANVPVVVMLKQDAKPVQASQAIAAGAGAAVPHDIDAELLASVFGLIEKGMTIVAYPAESEHKTLLDFERLSDRELQVLDGICSGLQNKEIAHNFKIKEVTVKMHVRGIIRKLGARNRTHAAMIARDLGIVACDGYSAQPLQ